MIAFCIVIGVSFLSNYILQNYLARLAIDVVSELELSIVEKVRNTEFSLLNRLGNEKIYAALGDIRLLKDFPQILVYAINYLICILCAIVYLCWVSWKGALLITVVLLILALFYWKKVKSDFKNVNIIKQYQNIYFSFLNDLLSGFKQIKIDKKRNSNLYFKYILANREKVRIINYNLGKKNVTGQLFASYSFYVILGLIVFIVPMISKIEIQMVTVFVTTLIFILPQISGLVNFMPYYTLVRIADERMKEIDKILKSYERKGEESYVIIDKFESIKFENVEFIYGSENIDKFSLCIKDFQIRKGEVLFIVYNM